MGPVTPRKKVTSMARRRRRMALGSPFGGATLDRATRSED
jgi:hypothetical protein